MSQQIKKTAARSAEIFRIKEKIIMKEELIKIIKDRSDVPCDNIGVGVYPKTPFEERMVGIAYSTWMRSDLNWDRNAWSKPLYGTYRSDDEEIIRRHGEMLAKAGVDFIFVDWSNNTGYVPETMSKARNDFRTIEVATDMLFDIWKDIPGAPKIALFAGPGHNGPESVASGDHDRKVNQIYRDYVTNPSRRDMYFYYEGKPLLLCYGATPNFYGPDPEWNDDRFTVRWVTGYVGQQSELYDKETRRSYRFWSWEERGAQTFTVSQGTVESVTITAATREQSKEGQPGYIPVSPRNNGETFKRQFQRAYNLGARIALIVTWNEWMKGEQISDEISKDIEPSEAHGTFYYDLMCEQIKKFKGISE